VKKKKVVTRYNSPMNRTEARAHVRTHIARRMRTDPGLSAEDVLASLKIPAALKREVLAEHRAAKRLQGSWRRRSQRKRGIKSPKRGISDSVASRNAAAHIKFLKSLGTLR